MSLLVVRLGAMGDILHALPAITALRSKHPGWRIDWAVEPQWIPLLSAEPGGLVSGTEGLGRGGIRDPAQPIVDSIFTVPAKLWARSLWRRETLASVRALRAKLLLAEYDAVLDLQGALRSAAVAQLSGSRRIIGEAQPREFAARWLFTELIEADGEHVIDQDVQLAAAVAGDDLEAKQPELPIDARAELWCDQLQQLSSAIAQRRPVVLIHPGGGWGAKRWPAERYAKAAQEFARRGGLVLVNSAPGEESLAKAVTAAAHPEVIAVECSLPQLTALTRRVSMVIGGDTGPLHLACMLGKPVVGIYGPTEPKRNGPYGSRSRVLRHPGSQRDHTRRGKPEAGLLTIEPEMVVAAAVDLMMEELMEQQRAKAEARQEPDARQGFGRRWDDGLGWRHRPQSEANRDAQKGSAWENGRP